MHFLFYTGHNILSTQGLSTAVSVGLLVGALLGFLSALWISSLDRGARAQRARSDELVARVLELRERVVALEAAQSGGSAG